jgi:nitrate reductase NapAB chaperone NapD
MAIRSLLLHIGAGHREGVARALAADPHCDVYPATNRDVIVLVTDHDDAADEEGFDRRLASMPEVLSIAVVAGFAE